MFRLVILCGLVACVFGDEEAFEASPDHLKFVYYDRRHLNGFETLANDPKGLKKIVDAFDTNKKTVILFHGWQDTFEADSNTYVRKAILNALDANVIKVGWGSLAIATYSRALRAVPSVGRVAAEFLDKLIAVKKHKLDRVTVVGFSLGAHAAGHLGRNLKSGKLPQIVGLDPAGPLISNANKLSKNDAKYVQVIHTSAGTLGTISDVGHSDFYPNGGGSQPGCGVNFGCSHGRAWEIFADSIEQSNLIGQKCGSYGRFQKNKCKGNPTSRFGGLQLDTSGSGVYYFTTNKKAPFGQGKPQ